MCSTVVGWISCSSGPGQRSSGPGVLAQPRGRIVGQNLPLAQHHDSLGHFFEQLGHRRGEHHGPIVAGREPLQHASQGQDAGRIESAGKGFVEQQDRRFGHQHRGQRDFLLLPVGIAGDGPISLGHQVEQQQQAIDMIQQPLIADLVQAPHRGQKLAAGRTLGEPGMVAQVADAAADRQLVVNRGVAPQAVDFDRAALRLQEPGRHAQKGRLTHAVGTNDGGELAGGNLEIDPSQHGAHAVMLHDVDKSDHLASLAKTIDAHHSSRTL